MEAINQLEHSYFRAKSAGGSYEDCIEWALDRLRRNEEGDDSDVIMLAASEEPEEARTFAELVIGRYSGQQALDGQLAGGKYLVSLRHDYQRGAESVHTLESKLFRLYERLEHPSWLSVLCRNCRHAREVPAYRTLFDEEFAYVARLWAVSGSRESFHARYNHAISLRHDAP